jgi:hypothetical protein
MLSFAFGLECSHLVLTKQMAVEIRRPSRPTIYWSPPRKKTQHVFPLVVLPQPERSREILELGKLRNIVIPLGLAIIVIHLEISLAIMTGKTRLATPSSCSFLTRPAAVESLPSRPQG